MSRSLPVALVAALLLSTSAWADGDAPVSTDDSASSTDSGSAISLTDEGGGASARSERWSVLSGRTVGAGALVIHPEFGWPGVGATILYGSTPTFDIGGKFTFNYGLEGQLSIAPELKFQAVMRFALMDNGNVSLGLRLEPGIALAFIPDVFGIGILIPVEFAVGFHLTELVSLVIGFDLPISLLIASSQFGSGVYFNIPIEFGPGVEFKLDRNLALTFNTRFGPFITAGGGGAGVNFAFQTLMGIAIHL